jgi:CheY-like chemotaxis protein/CHASE3 domain sensor protein/putative methionine-R-sulfoxide reductase with GAF domain
LDTMLENIKLSKKLIGGFLLVALIAGGIGIFGVIQLEKVNDADTFLFEKATFPLGHLAKMDSGFERAAANLSYYLLERDPAYLTIFDEAVKEVETNIENYRDTFFNAEDERVFAEFVLLWQAYLKIQDEEKRFALDGKFEEGLALRNSAATAKSGEIREILFELVSMNITTAKALAEENRRTVARSSLMIYLSIFFGVLAALWIGFSITRSIDSPIQKVVKTLQSLAAGGSEKIQVVEAIAGGDLSKRVTVTQQPDIETDMRRKDELGVLLNAVSELCDVVISLEEGIAGMTGSLLRNRDQERDRDWMKTGVNDLNDLVRGEKTLDDMTGEVLAFLSTYLKVGVSALYLYEEKRNTLRIAANYAFTRRKSLNDRIRLGEGLAGEAAREKRPICLSNIPPGYLAIGSALGEAIPQTVLALPLLYDDQLIGVMEFGSFKDFSELELEFLKQAGEVLAIAINVNLTRRQVNKLLEESQSQMEELQSQQEELKSANEELEEQAQALQLSEERLKAQQEELQVTNEELEERNEALNIQKREIERTKKEIEEKAEDLAVASKYKSEFLANMSHELRTPLNSLLLLARSLADNKEGNLSADQVESAGIIHGSGNDLLGLINEILDLSKIEAGQMDLHLEKVSVQEIAASVKSNFQHMTDDKGLALELVVDENAPEVLSTDRKRVDQVLRNFMSNAIKFTHQGSISVRFSRPAGDTRLDRSGLDIANAFSIAVEDTGIGIPSDKQKLIFEAFQQAQGGTSREYGGTGLGLSISRELVRLLGGEIQLVSREGEGSTFTVYLPIHSEQGAREAERGSTTTVRDEYRTPAPNPQVPLADIPAIPDDRDRIEKGDRTILVIEDDLKFARILLKYCHEKGFKCLAAATGEEGLELAERLVPEGILLDIQLPGIDGWSVLETLKGNQKTRHIPVHIVSAEATTIDARKKGAIGFLSKPTSHEQLDGALNALAEMFSKRMKELLVVEDDDNLRKGIIQLVGNGDVHAEEASTGKEALQALRDKKYDCMILDLGLPDMTGFDLLNQAGKESENNELPPVVVYTGKEIPQAEEEELRGYAETIIVKGVKSDERLFDEVSLFLHRRVTEMPENQRKIITDLHDADRLFVDKKILIVDDDMRNVFALSKLLKEKGMIPLKAEDGQKAIDILANEPDVDLVLMDIMMPVMDGYETMKRIRAQQRFHRLPIIALTAKAMKEDRERCLTAGANDYLPKPVDVNRLFSMMRVWLYR